MSIEQSQYSGSQTAFIETVEVTDGTTTLRYVLGNADVVAGGMTFTALPMDADSFAPPAQDSDGAQEITIAMDNVDGLLSKFAYDMNRNKTSGAITRRTYDESDLGTAVAEYQMAIKSASYTIMSVSFVCGYMTILDLAWPRNTYNLIDYPGIRYL